MNVDGRHLAVAIEVEGAVVQPAGREFAAGVAMLLVAVARATVDPRPRLHGLELLLREELVVALVRPAPSRRPSLGRGVHGALEEGAHLGGPGVAIAVVGKLGGRGIQAGEVEECIEIGSRRTAAGDDGVLLRSLARLGHREATRIGIGIALIGLRAELLEQQQRLGERLGAEQRARLAVGGDVEGGLRIRRQDVFLQRCLAVALHPAGLDESPGVGFLHALQEVGFRVFRRIGEGGRVTGWRRPEIVQRGRGGGYRQAQQKQRAGHLGGFAAGCGLAGELCQTRNESCCPGPCGAGFRRFHGTSPSISPLSKGLSPGSA
ncbi:hypothetical protein FQZ97_484890 [compost metagenome]